MTKPGNREDSPLPDRPGWSPGDSVTRQSREQGGRAKPRLCGPDPWARPGAVRPHGKERPKRLELTAWIITTPRRPHLPTARPEAGRWHPPGNEAEEVSVRPARVPFFSRTGGGPGRRLLSP
ncbi:hypothetical protein NDU88_007461 [Pleurodeles waltl]|uniref:Uncharacterized protein n=1 Tax=Pleurodeles waltl TaxID=8319 RepID=A0AAV7NWC2_PLEWA|nr:hypothetical protein NDU88_007461 [Pleurodeles waltl]